MKIKGPSLKEVYILKNFISYPYLQFLKPNPFTWLGGSTVLLLNPEYSQQGQQVPETQCNYLKGDNGGTVSSSGHAKRPWHPKGLPVFLGHFLIFWLSLALVLTFVASSSSRTITLQMSPQRKSPGDAPWPALNLVSSPELRPLISDKTRILMPEML